MVAFRGTDADGLAHAGRRPAGSTATFVEERFKAGWTMLAVYDPDSDTMLGRIGRLNGVRTWWAEDDV